MKAEESALAKAMQVINQQQERIQALEASALKKDIILEPYVEFIANVPTKIPGKRNVVSPAEWLDWAKNKLGYVK